MILVLLFVIAAVLMLIEITAIVILDRVDELRMRITRLNHLLAKEK